VGLGQAEFYEQEVGRGPNVPGPSQWVFERPQRGQWGIGSRRAQWRHRVTGETVGAGRVPGVKGGFRYTNPEYAGQRSPLFGVDAARRKRHRKALVSLVTGPGALGVWTGLALPSLLSAKALTITSAAIGLGGYVAPQGSWLRRFSIGAGVGAGGRAGLWAARQPWAGDVFRAVKGGAGLARVAARAPWTHYIPFVGQLFQTLDPLESTPAGRRRLERGLRRPRRR